MTATTLALVLGVAALWLGGEQFVLGASRLATRTRMPTILVGMVVAGFGTSTPELTVSVLAQVRDEPGLALGNALGSNVANVLLVLPLAALARGLTVRGELLRREVGAMVGGSALVVAVAADGRIGRAEAVLLVAVFAALMLALARAGLRTAERTAIEAEIEEIVGEAPATATRLAREVVRTVLGLAIVLASADRLVWGAGALARDLGLSEATIGLTIVAVGTSLPEVVTALVAARRGEADLVLGTVLGSNLFNALLIVGVAGLAGPLAIAGRAHGFALAGAMGTAVLPTAFLLPGYRITRKQAWLGLAAYALFVIVVAVWGR